MVKMQTTVDENYNRHVAETARAADMTEADVRRIAENFRNAVVVYDNRK